MSATSEIPGDGGGRTGRRPGQSGTRAAIVAAARSRFAEAGFDRASIRSIAAEAGVDPALIHHYFGTKKQLFTEVISLPVDPETALAPLADAPLDDLGETLLRTIVGIWDSPAGTGAIAALRSVLAGGEDSLIRSFLIDVALRGVRARVDDAVGDGDERIALVVSQMIGVLATRKILLLEPVASMSIDQLAVAVAPTLQRYLTGDLT
ncbi:TetR/AcrR family transcriptional regulator [Gordonia iterans]